MQRAPARPRPGVAACRRPRSRRARARSRAQVGSPRCLLLRAGRVGTKSRHDGSSAIRLVVVGHDRQAVAEAIRQDWRPDASVGAQRRRDLDRARGRELRLRAGLGLWSRLGHRHSVGVAAHGTGPWACSRCRPRPVEHLHAVVGMLAEPRRRGSSPSCGDVAAVDRELGDVVGIMASSLSGSSSRSSAGRALRCSRPRREGLR